MMSMRKSSSKDIAALFFTLTLYGILLYILKNRRCLARVKAILVNCPEVPLSPYCVYIFNALSAVLCCSVLVYYFYIIYNKHIPYNMETEQQQRERGKRNAWIILYFTENRKYDDIKYGIYYYIVLYSLVYTYGI